MHNEKDVLLKVENLKQYFPLGKKAVLKAVDDVSFYIKKGEVFGLVGESGCGKTTTGRTIIKLNNITSGNVYFKDQRICAGVGSYEEIIEEAKAKKKTADAQEKERLNKLIAEQMELIKLAKRDNDNCDKIYAEKVGIKNERIITKIQMIFQDPIASLNPRMTVREIIAEGLRINGVKDEKFIDDKVYKMLDLVGLVPEHAGRYPHEFSGGQRQRIGIARALTLEPELVIADEPISALDVSVKAQIINLLNDLRNQMGLTILFIAHDLSVVKYFSDRIGVMYFGKIVELASSKDLFENPMHPYTKSLLSAIPLPDPHYERKRKRITYNPSLEHDYSIDKPTLRDIGDEHYVYCNEAEYNKYVKQLNASSY
ncbi:ATP-binding cassette domain-containing protein [Proteiniborus sp. MB09-C3]|uniref:ABC transporter ATP-binding protein n=1 Tax=Proteiniborus sp. MB09-C3 TaxID=3050072 RepID=UPI0025549442|nr:ATP-binding cassette domain-containing protein [Proteiniborus sp. MB09-C3]WIV11698.1 ATP-binding cassette domain-containing protein [Proteiniborus sp. MB09-C3]